MHATKLIAHKGDTCIAVAFEKKQKLISRLKKLDGALLTQPLHLLAYGKQKGLVFYPGIIGTQ